MPVKPFKKLQTCLGRARLSSISKIDSGVLMIFPFEIVKT